MNPGTLDRKLQLQRQADGLFMVTSTGEYMTTAAGERMTTSIRKGMTTSSRKGRFGAELDDWGLWKSRMGKRLENRGSETSGNARERTAGQVTFRIRYTAGLRSADRLVDVTDGQAYDIEEFLGDPRQGWMEIICTRYRTPANENQTYS